MRRIINLIVIIGVLVVLPISLTRAQNETLGEVGSYATDARAARIASLKDIYKISLTDKEKALVMSRCLGAQDSLTAIHTKAQITKVARTKTYTNLTQSLTNLRLKLDAKQVDASNLDLLIVNYQQKISDFDKAVDAYETTLEDVTQVDCVNKPEDFRAALEGVRNARKTVVDQSSEIREITKSNLKTTFDSISLKITTTESTNGK
jgi:2C-methyl-D-erythritol 2,4-cyclodiphosphate synthase